jgi:hypothetical protein
VWFLRRDARSVETGGDPVEPKKFSFSSEEYEAARACFDTRFWLTFAAGSSGQSISSGRGSWKVN